MTAVDGIEINVPGDLQCPYHWCSTYLEMILETLDVHIQNATALLELHSSAKKEWVPECLAILGSAVEDSKAFRIEFANEDDPYGLWSVSYTTLTQFEVGEIRRVQA